MTRHSGPVHIGGVIRNGTVYENDIASLLYAYKPVLEPLVGELGEHRSEPDLAAPRDILADIRQRIARFSQGTSG
jgi:hypothetical protein